MYNILRMFWRIVFVSFAFCYVDRVNAEIEPFVETFDGNGEYSDISGRFFGFDLPDWKGGGEFIDGGLRSLVIGPGNETFLVGQSLRRNVSGAGSFISRVEFSDTETYADELAMSNALMRLEHSLGPNQRPFGVHLDDVGFEFWSMGTEGSRFLRIPAPSQSAALELRFDYPRSMGTVIYDNDLSDDDPAPYQLGPFETSLNVTADQAASFLLGAGGHGRIQTDIDHWSLQPWITDAQGDFDDDGVLDAVDIELLTEVIRGGEAIRRYDLNADFAVTINDLQYWIEKIAGTYVGDSNLDGVFDSADLVQVFVAAEYEDSLVGNSTWSTGDWNGDREFDSRDLVFAFSAAGYEKGPRSVTTVTTAVPEPTFNLLPMLFGIVALILRHRK